MLLAQVAKESVSTIAMSSGKWYWEYEITASNEHIVGVGPLDMQMSGNLGAGSPPGSMVLELKQVTSTEQALMALGVIRVGQQQVM